MNRGCFIFSLVILTIQLSAMQQEHQETTLTDLDENCLRTIARFVDHQSCAHARKTCQKLNATFWNDSQPLEICPALQPRDATEKAFWQALIEKIMASEAMIKRFNLKATKKVDIQNAIILKLCRCSLFTTMPEAFAQTTCVRSVDLSYARVPDHELAKLPRLLPALYALDLTGNTLKNLPKEYAEWTSLRRLFLCDNNDISKTSETGVPRHLEFLDISQCGYTCIPVFLKDMKQLKGLNLSYNRLAANLSKLPLWLPLLEELDLSNNSLRSIPFRYFRNFKCLLRLKLYNNCLNMSLRNFPQLAQDLHEIEMLDLGLNCLMKLPLAFGQFKNLKLLHLEGRPGSPGYDVRKENVFSHDQQAEICQLLPNTKIIFERCQ